ncbi:RPM1-interacting protein 4-like [Curcuma longa]|uniref:RPM1-interacting protein 4-like n=1 Tax=Curcuma longa TaxID=136217 RepID=UPI003D9F5CD9
MSENTLIPKFGNWDGSFPYSQCFDDARKGRSGRETINPHDPYDNPEAFSANMSLAQSPATASYSEATKLKDEVHIRREANHRHEDQKTSGNHRRMASRGSGSSNYKGIHSPLHPSHEMKNPHESWPSCSSSFASKSARRSRMTGVEDDNKQIKKGSIVPKFGDWDVSNPSSADGFTVIFDKVRQEKQAGVTTTARMSSDTTHTQKSSGYWCFGWCK